MTRIKQELDALQKERGHLDKAGLRALARRIREPLHRLHEVASFFPHFRLTPPPQVSVGVCRDLACGLRGSRALREELHAALHSDGVPVTHISCLGRCDRAPAVRIATPTVERNYLRAAATRVQDAVRSALDGELPAGDLDAREGAERPTWQIDVGNDYATARAFAERLRTDPDAAPREAISALESAGLLGMGGAGGRAYKKWSDVLGAPGDVKYVVCNGDESEPATFKDRELLLHAPWLTLEGMLLAGLLLGAERGFVYLRHEYDEQIAAVEAELKRMREQGLTGTGILGTDRSFELEVFISPGGYICGEQTALIEAIQSNRAEPRNRPPELQTNGLWDRPTLLNNVETFAWVPSILARGDGSWFAGAGVRGQRGMRFFSVSGDVASPGVFEVPNGITLRELIERAGGMADGQTLKAVAASGPSGGFLPRRLPRGLLPPRFADEALSDDATHFDILDWELSIPTARAMGVMLGAGLVIYGDRADMVEQAVISTTFYRRESCGKCVPCRIGSAKLDEIGERLRARQLSARDMEAIRSEILALSSAMEETAICGLGTVASNPLRTLLGHFGDEVAGYLEV